MTVTPKDKDNDDARPAEQEEIQPESEELTPETEDSSADHPPSDDSLEEGDVEDSETQLDEEDELDALRTELERVRAEGQEYLDGWQRSRAEFVNYRKRVERENQESYQRVAGDIFCRYLGIIDDLELALRERPQDGDAGVWADGIGIVHQKLISLLEAEGVEPIEAEGKQFDPNYHEALSHEEDSEHEEGQIIEVIRQGYRLGARVLRPALVRVAK
jgi:molecular chaperone GrpE